MVRLKVANYNAAYQDSYLVSIPHGTIKRFFEILKIRVLTWFQFHMVRLKDCMYSFLTDFVVFQFHMVRLKASL